MLQINKGFLALSLLCVSASNAMQLTHKGNDFFVENENETSLIQRAFIDKELRGISEERLAKLAAAGAYLKLNKMEDSDDYTLRLGGRLNGGGPLFGAFLAGLAKAIGYGVPVVVGSTIAGAAVTATAGHALGTSATISAAAAQSGVTAGLMQSTATAAPYALQSVVAGFEGLPVVGFANLGGTTFTAAQALQFAAATEATMGIPAVGYTSLAANTAVSQAAGAAVSSTIYAAPGLNVVAGGVTVGKAIVMTVGAEVAGYAVAGVATAANGAAGYVAMVEGISAAAGVIGTACPFLP